MALPSPLPPAPPGRLRAGGRAACLLAALAAAALLLAGCGGGSGTTSAPSTPGSTADTTPVTTTIPTTGNRAIDAYLRDVNRAAVALADFSRILAQAGIGTQLRARQGDLRAALGRFDTAMGNIGRRHLPPVPSIEKQRDRISLAGRRLSTSLVRFIDAAARGRVSTVQALLPDVTMRIDDFRTAASP